MFTGPLRKSSLGRDVVEVELDRQILASERLCAGALAFVMGVLLLSLTVGLLATESHGVGLPGLPARIMLLTGAIGYQVLAFFVLRHLAEQRLRLPDAARFVNAFIETSFPTLLVLNLAANSDPMFALNSPSSSFYFLIIILSALRLNPILCVFTGCVAAAQYGGLVIAHWDVIRGESRFATEVDWFIFALRSVTLVVAGLTAAFVSMQIKRRLFETLQAVKGRAEAVEMFGKHVSPEVVDTLLAQGVVNKVEAKDVCVMVLDIRSFTTYSEHLPPEKVVDHLNALWSLCVKIINSHHGTVNKFLGDGFMAIFGAPMLNANYREHAVAASQEIIEEINQRVSAGEIEPTKVGIGLHAGPVLAGSVGSDERKEYTVIGDVVNVAFRIEELNKQFDSELLASDAVCSCLDMNEIEDKLRIESIKVKGRSQAVNVFRLA